MNFILVFLVLSFSSNLLANIPTAIYDTDSRHEVFDYPDPRIADLSRSTVALVSHSNLQIVNQELSISSLLSISFQQHANLCSTERFKNQPVGAFCSGFLVSPNKIVTAGHCVDSYDDCRNMKIVFDYAMIDDNFAQTTFFASQVYECKKIIKKKNEKRGLDFAIIELDRIAEYRTPLKLSENKTIEVGTEIFTIGYPSGLPAKITDDAKVKSVNPSKGYFVTNLDTFHGNSGSPVFNYSTLEVEGVLVRGLEDFKVSIDGCNKVSRVEDGKGVGEDVTLISQVFDNLDQEVSSSTEPSRYPLGDFQIRSDKKICLVYCKNSTEYTPVTRMVWNDPSSLITTQEQCQRKAELACTK